MTYDKPISNRSDAWLKEIRELEAEAYDDTCVDVCATEVPTPAQAPRLGSHPRPAREQPLAQGRRPVGQQAGVHGDSLPARVAAWLRLGR